MLLRLCFLPAIIVLALAFFGVPSFIQMYASFGAELPVASRFLFSWYRLLAFLPFLFLPIWFYWPQRNSRGIVALVTSLVLSAALLVFGVWAAYAPLYILGSAS